MKKLLILPLFLGLSACQESSVATLQYTPPKVSVSALSGALASLPSPMNKLSVAVYSFHDMTGQRRRSDTVSDMSSAVTQGAGDFLVKALKDAGDGSWFQVVERQGVDNLLKERQIIKSTREEFADGQRLPPLLFAGMIIEGGIVAYDSNISQGGFGARILGIGANTEWRLDQVTVAVRIVSVQTGEVIMAHQSAKSVYSAMIASNVFRYVAENRILEMDAGNAGNEPMQMAVREAVEHSVLMLAEDGAKMGLWQFADTKDLDRVSQVVATVGQPRHKHEELLSELKPQAHPRQAPTVVRPAPQPAPMPNRAAAVRGSDGRYSWPAADMRQQGITIGGRN